MLTKCHSLVLKRQKEKTNENLKMVTKKLSPHICIDILPPNFCLNNAQLLALKLSEKTYEVLLTKCFLHSCNNVH